MRVSGNFSVAHGEALRRAVLDGLGIAYMPTFIVGPDIAAGRLQSTLHAQVQSRQHVYAVYPASRNLTPKVSAFVDFLVERFRPEPPWDGPQREPGTRRAAQA